MKGLETKFLKVFVHQFLNTLGVSQSEFGGFRTLAPLETVKFRSVSFAGSQFETKSRRGI